MLINLSNHPSESWGEKQKQVAEQQFGQTIDLLFPAVPTNADLDQVIELVEQYVDKCDQLLNRSQSQNKNEPEKTLRDAIHVMGEMTFVYQFVQKMSEQGILCVASTSERIADEKSDGTKISRFEFVRFRPYTVELF